MFDVEVAFFFPWATLYGGTMQLADTQLDTAARFDLTDKLLNRVPGTSAATGEFIASGEAVQLGLLAFSDIMVFFGVLLVGFAYVWKRGDLEWVRAAINSSRQRALPDQ